MATLRVYLTGRISIECGGQLIQERDLTGRQGRLAFTFLAAHRHRPVSRDELLSVVWQGAPPRELDVAINAILSKLRAALKKTRLSGSKTGIDVRSGTIHLNMPTGAWIDIEDAANSIDESEGALRANDLRTAWSFANVVISVARRPFLAGEEAPWIEAQRTKLRSLLVRGLQCLSTISAANGEPSLAVEYASEIIELEPFRETAYRQLMRLHAQMGNRAEALRVFGRCRQLLREELGADPSHETETVFLEILRAGQ